MDLQVEINKIEIKIEDILEAVSLGTPKIIAKYNLEDLRQQAEELSNLYAPCGKLVLRPIELLIRKINNVLEDICGFTNASTTNNVN